MEKQYEGHKDCKNVVLVSNDGEMPKINWTKASMTIEVTTKDPETDEILERVSVSVPTNTSYSKSDYKKHKKIHIKIPATQRFWKDLYEFITDTEA